MPKSKFERAVFGGMMALAMVYGMEVYNHSLRNEGVSSLSLHVPLDEMLGLSFFVFLLQEFVGGPLARRLSLRIVDLRTTSPARLTLTFSVLTVLCMCPLMSLATTLIFQGSDANIASRWLEAFRINLPMAFVWQLLVAGPLVRFLFRSLFPRPLPR